eukprot:TRINITY_DN2508_c0_g1_i5.p1 TRINITY_DN2508_c0_g1~~TRINITY_DN2508_c0_g1_i5.p1  ORF type:complete len:763 (+),score=111.54 TRINITY_DN2508_c0_g1_i5:177-2291(+)
MIWDEYESESERPFTKGSKTSWKPYYFYRSKQEQVDQSLVDLYDVTLSSDPIFQDQNSEFEPTLHPTCSFQSRLSILQNINLWLNTAISIGRGRAHTADIEVAKLLPEWIDYAFHTGLQKNNNLAIEAVVTIGILSNLMIDREVATREYPNVARTMDLWDSNRFASFILACLEDIFATFPMGSTDHVTNFDPMGTRVTDHVIDQDTGRLLATILDATANWVVALAPISRRQVTPFVKSTIHNAILPLFGTTFGYGNQQNSDLHAVVSTCFGRIAEALDPESFVPEIVMPIIELAKNEPLRWHLTKSALYVIRYSEISFKFRREELDRLARDFIMPQVSSANPYLRDVAIEVIAYLELGGCMEPSMKSELLAKVTEMMKDDQPPWLSETIHDLVNVLCLDYYENGTAYSEKLNFQPFLKILISEISSDRDCCHSLIATSSILSIQEFDREDLIELIFKLKPLLKDEASCFFALDCLAAIANHLNEEDVNLITTLVKQKLLTVSEGLSLLDLIALQVVGRLLSSGHMTQKDVPWIAQVISRVSSLQSEHTVTLDTTSYTDEDSMSGNDIVQNAKQDALKLLMQNLDPNSKAKFRVNFDEYESLLVTFVTECIRSPCFESRDQASHPGLLIGISTKYPANFDLIYRSLLASIEQSLDYAHLKFLSQFIEGHLKIAGNLPEISETNILPFLVGLYQSVLQDVTVTSST